MLVFICPLSSCPLRKPKLLVAKRSRGRAYAISPQPEPVVNDELPAIA